MAALRASASMSSRDVRSNHPAPTVEREGHRGRERAGRRAEAEAAGGGACGARPGPLARLSCACRR